MGIVEDGRALVEEARRLRPDVIVADIGMPLLNGIDALAQLKTHDPRVKVVFLTMHREVAYARRALEAGASGFVLKHSAPEELVMAIRAALSQVRDHALDRHPQQRRARPFRDQARDRRDLM